MPRDTPTPTGSLTILVIDDEPQIRRLVSNALTPLALFGADADVDVRGKPEHVVATRLITVQGGTVITEGERLEIRLPTTRPAAV